MANELKFSAVIDDKVTKTLDDIQKKINGMQDLTINLKMGGGGTSELQSELANLHNQFEKLRQAKRDFSDMNISTEKAREEIGRLGREIGSLENSLRTKYQTKNSIKIIDPNAIIAQLREDKSKIISEAHDAWKTIVERSGINPDVASRSAQTNAELIRGMYDTKYLKKELGVAQKDIAETQKAYGNLFRMRFFDAVQSDDLKKAQGIFKELKEYKKEINALLESGKAAKNLGPIIDISNAVYGDLEHFSYILNRLGKIKRDWKKAVSASDEQKQSGSKVQIEEQIAQIEGQLTQKRNELAQATDRYTQSLAILNEKESALHANEQKFNTAGGLNRISELQKQIESGTATTPSKDMKVEVTLDRTKFDEQLNALADYITKWQNEHKIVIDANVQNVGGSVASQNVDTVALQTAKEEATKKVNEALKEQERIEAELLELRSKQFTSYDEKQIKRARQELEDAQRTVQELSRKYGVSSLEDNNTEWTRKRQDIIHASQQEIADKQRALDEKHNAYIEAEYQKVKEIMSLREKDYNLKWYTDPANGKNLASAHADENTQAIKYFQAELKKEYLDYAEVFPLKERLKEIKSMLRSADIDDSQNGNIKAWKDEKAILEELIKVREKYFNATTKNQGYESKATKAAFDDQQNYSHAISAIKAYGSIVSEADRKEQEWAAHQDAISQKKQELAAAIQKVNTATEAESKAVQELANAQKSGTTVPTKNSTPQTADVTLHVKLDEWTNVEPQLQAIKTQIGKWSETNPIVLTTKLSDPQNGSEIKLTAEKLIAQTGNATPELQKQLGTGNLTQQWKDAYEALVRYMQEYSTLQSKKGDNFAIATGKNQPIFHQLESVLTLFNQAKMSIDSIDPSKLTIAVNMARDVMRDISFDNASSGMKMMINNLQATISEMERVGVQGVSPMENAILKMEASVANAVIGINSAIREMVDALSKDNLTAFATRATAAADAIQKLSEGVGGFNNVAVNQEGMRDLLTGLGALINNLKEINGGNPIKGADAMLRQYENDVEKIKKVITGLIADEEKLRAAMALGNTNENANTRFGTQLQAIEDYKAKLQGLLNTKFADWDFDAVKKTLVGEQALLKSETTASLAYAESMRVAGSEVEKLTLLLEKYNAILAQLQQRGMDSMGVDTFVKKIQDQIGVFSSILNSQTIGGVEASKNNEYTAMLTRAAVAGSDAAQTLKEWDSATKTTTTTVEKLTQAQKDLDAAIANGKQKGADVSGVEAMRTEVMSLINAAQQAKSPQDAVASLVGSKQTIDESTQAIRNLNAAIKENEAIEKNRIAAQNKMADLDIKLRKMEAIERQRKALPDDMQGGVTNLAQQYRDILSVRTQLNAVATGVDNTKVSDILAQSENYTKLKNAISDTTTALQELKQQQMLNRKNQAGRSFQDLSDSIQELDNLKAKARNNGYIIDPNLEQNIANARAELVKFRDELEKVMNGTSNKSALSITGQDAYKQAKDNAALQATVLKEAMDKQMADNKNVQAATEQFVKYELAAKKIADTLTDLKAKNDELTSKVNLQPLEDELRKLEAIRDKMQAIKEGNDTSSVKAFLGMETNLRAVEKAGYAASQAVKKVNAEAKAEGKTAATNNPIAKNMDEAYAAVERLTNKMTALNELAVRAGKAGVDETTIQNLKTAIAELEQYRQKLLAIRDGNSTTLTSSVVNDPAYKTALNQAQDAKIAINNAITAAKAANTNATSKLTEEEQRLAKAIQEANNAGHQQSQILSDLRSMAMQYMSVYYVQQFVKEMANITGELELQQRALEVILGNASYAQSMYADVRELSQMSPFSLMDLMKSTRQLAAFGIEAKDLYGTMRALSDISAGLSVDVNRLILAYGHTRSYGYLSGIQNRQFENAGIDMIGGLVDRYNKLAEAEKAAGRNAEFLTRKDIFKKMRAKEIPFEDVESVVMQLDQPGGKFYNMQEKQFDTLGGKLRNLANNYNIMMSEIGNSQHGLLMKGVSLITDVHEHWSRYAKVIMDVVAALGVMKVAQLAVGNATMATNAQLAKTALMNEQNAWSSMYLNNYNRWTNAQGKLRGGWGQIAHNEIMMLGGVTNTPVATDTEVKGLAQNQEINNLTKQRVALTAKLTQAQREFLLVSAGINPVQASNIAGMNAMGRGLLVLRLGFIQAAISAKAFAMSILTNPMMWVMAAVAGLMHLNQKFSETSDAAKEMNDNIDRTMREDMRGVREILNGYKGMIENVDAKVIKLKPGALDGKEVEDVINNLKQKLQAQSPIYDKDLFDIMKLESQEKQVEAMLQKLKDIEIVKQIELDTKDSFTQSIEETGAGWTTFWRGEGLTTNMNDAAEQGKVLKAFSIPKEAWENWTTEGKKQINAYVKELGVTREQAAKALLMQGESFGKLFHDSGNDGSKYANFQSVAEQYQNELATALGDMDPVATDTAGTIVASMLGDPSNQQMLIEDRLNQLFLKAKVGDENTKMAMRAKFIELIAASMPKAEGDRLIANNLEAFLGAEILKQARAGVNSGTKKSELAGIAKQSVEKAIKIVSAMNPKHAAQYAKLAKDGYDAYVRAATQEAKKSILSEDWQQRALKMNIRPQVGIDLDYTEFMDKQRKKLKEIQDKFKKNKQRLKWIIGTDITLDLNTKSVQAAIKKLTEIYNKLGQKNAELYKGGITDKEYGQLEQNRGQRETLKQTLETLKEMETIGKYMDSEHQSWKDDSKDKKGNKKDQQLDDLKERGKLIRDAYDYYKKWNGEVGKKSALNKANAEYADLLKKFGLEMKDIPQYQENLVKLIADAEKLYNGSNKDNKKQRLEYLKELKKTLGTTKFDVFKENSDEALSAVQRRLEDLTRQWEIFNSVRDATGDMNLATRMAGISANQLLTGTEETLPELLKRNVFNELQKGKFKSGVVFSEVIGLSDKELEQYVQNLAGGAKDSEEAIKAVIEALKKWRDAQRDLNKEDTVNYAKVLGSMMDLPSQLQRIDAEKKKQYESIERLENLYKETGGEKGISNAEGKKAREVVDAQALGKSTQISADYLNVFAYSLNKTTTVLEGSANVLRTKLKERLNKDLSPQQYAEEMAKIDKALREAMSKTFFGNSSNFATFMKGGLPALQEKADTDLAELRQLQAQGKATQEQVDDAEKFANKLANITRLLGDMGTTMSIVTGALDGLKGAVDALQQMFDSFGNETMANLLSDVSDGIGAISGIFSPVGNVVKSAMSGDVGGVISSAISSPFQMIASPITALNRLHDKKIERHIQEIKKEVSKLNNTMELIQTNRERQLGYDKGLSGNSSGYADELKNLQAQQKAYREMLAAEEDKKKSDDGAIEEYKSKINELQDKITYFTEDTLKSLYSIDLKSWAGTLGDALMTAWENGTDAAEAYDDAVRGILQDVVKNALQLAVVEPALKQLREDLAAIYDVNDPENSAKKMAETISEYLGPAGAVTKALDAVNTTLDETEKKLNAVGVSLRDAEEIAQEFQSIDVDGWAGQLSDALTNAFYNGELAAKSYADTVKSVMQQVVNSMLQTAYLEPMMDKLKKQLFGYTDADGTVYKGAFDASNPSGSIAEVSKVLSTYFGEGGEGKALITASTEFTNAMEQLLNGSGLSLLNTSSNSTNSIGNAATEETMGIVSGYLAAMRQDVSVQRIFITQIATEYMPEFRDSISASTTAMASIDRNVQNIYNAIHAGDGALYNAIKDVRDDLHGAIEGSRSIKMR